MQPPALDDHRADIKTVPLYDGDIEPSPPATVTTLREPVLPPTRCCW
jgi:hypothetical protein